MIEDCVVEVKEDYSTHTEFSSILQEHVAEAEHASGSKDPASLFNDGTLLPVPRAGRKDREEKDQVECSILKRKSAGSHDPEVDARELVAGQLDHGG